MKKIFLFHLLLVCPVIFLIWYIVFPNYLWLLEGNSFFSFTPDFAGIQLSLPSDWAQYVGAYLLQFFGSVQVELWCKCCLCLLCCFQPIVSSPV